MNILSFEVNFDGLVGPTHFYGGLSLGNQASMLHAGETSNPKAAALQGLEKMKVLSQLGIHQAVLPPHERPHMPTLRTLGFTGTDAAILSSVQKNAPWLMQQASSSAAMWTANAATVSPSIDSIDNHVHLTPANLLTMFHRSLETFSTQKVLKAIFPSPVFFHHHMALPESPIFADEGAANHTRFCKTYNGPGVEFFVYGNSIFSEEGAQAPERFPARQTLEASQAIARLHQLYPEHILFARQNPQAIDAGVFHNDVISLGNQHVFLTHELAFLNQKEVLRELKRKMREVCEQELVIIEIKNNQVSLEEAVATYLFNSQLVTVPDGSMALIAPIECQRHLKTADFLNQLIQNEKNPIASLHFVDLTQSMRNGGGPACLRLRVVLNENEMAASNQSVYLTDDLYLKLNAWINKHYPDTFYKQDLFNPKVYERNCQALDELTRILNLGKIYSFQL